MAFLQNLSCCAIRELANIQDLPPLEVLKQVPRRIYGSYDGRWPRSFRFLVFSQAGAQSKYGDKMAAFIEENKLGTVTLSAKGINPNTRRSIKVWVWTVDHTAVQRLLDKETPNATN